MNKLIKDLELDEINSQLRRAELQRNKLIIDIYKQYESYLKSVRDLLIASVEKGIYILFTEVSDYYETRNRREFSYLFEKHFTSLINSQLPLITIEQLKIFNKTKNNNYYINQQINQEKNFNDLTDSFEFKNHQKDNFELGDHLFSEDPIQFHINENIVNTYEYYQSIDNSSFKAIDFDNREQSNNFPKLESIKKIDIEKQIVSSLIELIEESNENKINDYENLINTSNDISSPFQDLNFLEKIDNSLNNLLLSLSFKINKELFELKIIKKIITEEAFKFLAKKKSIIKHPYPFLIDVDLNANQLLINEVKLPRICFLNITTVELEFKNLNLSIQRNKINEMKNQFQLLIKKERYWKQKEINLNKIEE